MCTLPIASLGLPRSRLPDHLSEITATYPGASVGTPTGAAVGRGVACPAGGIGGGVSPPRIRKTGSSDEVGLGDAPGIGGAVGAAVWPGSGCGVGLSWNVPFAAPGGMFGGAGVSGGAGVGDDAWATTSAGVSA